MDSDRGVPFWAQQGFEIQSPWGSIAPAKPVPADDQMSHPPYRMGFLDLLNGNCDGGLFQSILPPDSNSSTAPDYAGQFPGFSAECLIPGSRSSAVPDCAAGQLLQDLGGAAGFGYSGGVQGPQITGDPCDGWQRTAHTNSAYADAAAVASKGSFFTPLLLSQMAPDQSSSWMNGNAMASSSPSNFDLNLMTQSFFSSEPAWDENAPEPKHMPLQHQSLRQNDGSRNESFNQNIAGLSVELTPEEMAVLESYALANVVRDDRYAQQTIGTGHGNLMPQYPWTPASLERKMPLQTHKPPEFISMSNRDLIAQYPCTPARTEKVRPLQTQTLTELINACNGDFMPQYPWTPTDLQANRPPPGTRMPPEIIDLVDDSPGEQNNWEARQAGLFLPEPLSLPPPALPAPVSLGTATLFESALVQQQQADTEGVVSSAEAIDQATTAATQGLLENDDIDLNKAPRKKPKRKKHRPKVVREGKPARTPKPSTPKPVNTSGKRKYVRKNKAEFAPETLSAEPGGTAASGSNDRNRQEDSSKKWQRKRKNHPNDSPCSNAGGAAELESRYRNNAVRRQLDFTDEVVEDAYQRSTMLFTNNAECQYQEAYHASNTLNTNAAASVQQTKVVPGFPDGLHSSVNQEANEHIRLPVQPGRTESARTDPIRQAAGNSVPGFPISLPGSANQEANEHIRLPDKNLQPGRTESVRIDPIRQAVGNSVPGFPISLPSSANQESNEHIRFPDKNFQPGRTETARTDHIRQAVGNSVPGFPISLPTSSANQEPNEHIRLANKEVHPCRTENVTTDRILDQFRIAENSTVPPQVSKRENMKRLARKSSLRYTSNSNTCQELDSLKTSNVPGKRRISDIILDNNYQCLMNVNSIQAADGIKKLNQSQNAHHHDTMTQPENNTATRSTLALVPYYHSFAISAQNSYGQYSTKSRMKDKTQTFIPVYQEVLQRQKPSCSPLDDVIQKLRNLKLSEDALVIYKPKKLRPKVDLDPETTRVWNLLMVKEVGEDQESEVDKEKWWEKERQVFKARVHSFIERMHLVQGDRRFSKWKGSVVDSVVGVFLTQNVSDNLSSTAFMELAARFPPKSRCKNFESSVEESESSDQHLHEDSSIETVKGNGKRQEQISSDQHLHRNCPLAGETNNEIENSNESFGSNSSCTVANYTKVRSVDPKKKELGTSHDSTDSESSTPITQTSINLTEAEDRWSVEDAGSSQNSSENPLQVPNQIRTSSPEFLRCVSDQPYSQDFAAISGSVPVADFQQIIRNCMQPSEASKCAQLDLKDDSYISKKEKIKKNETDGNLTFDWDSLRKEVCLDGSTGERSQNTMDSVDWEAVRSADVKEIARAIEARGMNNLLAARIKGFLNRLVDKHKGIDLEWLRKVDPFKAKDYLISIQGLGLKSAECVRLLTLHNIAFPVDTNVCRVCVRLGWVPLQPLPDTLPLHLLELYPDPGTVQKYLWPRLCKLDQLTLYELHYQLITFGKVFCTKGKPNCNACPMRGECKHFASAFASSTFKLGGPEKKSTESSEVFAASQQNHVPVFNPTQQICQLEGTDNLTGRYSDNCQPIIEEPASPEPESTQIEESDIEDAFCDDPDEIPTIKLNIEKFTQNLQDYMEANNKKIQNGGTSSNLTLVITKPEDASIPMPKLKSVSRLRTEHLVYEIPDSHPLLEGFEPRESDDPSPYLLAIWTAGETATSTEPPKESCNSEETGVFCNKATCFTCSNRRELQAQIVRGTILIPCRTAMRGSFPLNGTYFQVNEVFADHDSSCNPIDVPREWIWNLRRRKVFFGTSATSIFKGLNTAEIQCCFWRGFVCVRGFDRKTRAPAPLCTRLHFSTSKTPKSKKQEKGSPAKVATNNPGQKGSIRS